MKADRIFIGIGSWGYARVGKVAVFRLGRLTLYQRIERIIHIGPKIIKKGA